MKYLIVTGMSGAGKTSAIHALEDVGYFCVDNLPPELIPKTIALWEKDPPGQNNYAFGVDIRGRHYFKSLNKLLSADSDTDCKVLFMDCRDEELIRRFQMTRREHPLQMRGGKLRRVQDALLEERELLMPLRAEADYVIDTTETNVWQARNEIQMLFGGSGRGFLPIQIISFGYSRGIPMDCDLVFDVRFLPNPYYLPELRDFSGLDEPVQEYVMRDGNGEAFLQKTGDLLTSLIPLYRKEGKMQLTVGIGCTGGRHRSVAIAEKLGAHLSGIYSDEAVNVIHRDMQETHKPTA